MKKMLVAVSGGVDSVVLLDFLAEKLTREHGAEFMRANLVVAHFEHGIRGAESLADLEFVKGLAEKYGVKLVFEYGDLGEKASEEVARKARYDFLRRVAEAENAVIFTAHHKNDLAETFALNLARGGGWRAVAFTTISLSPDNILTATPCAYNCSMASAAEGFGGSRKARYPISTISFSSSMAKLQSFSIKLFWETANTLIPC
jgi:tRNA(Ile)-lysidine synthetase-like protein